MATVTDDSGDTESRSVISTLWALVGSYFVNRIARTILVFLLAVTVAFALFRLLPQGPVDIMVDQIISNWRKQGIPITSERYEMAYTAVEQDTGIDPDAPIYTAYVDYMAEVVLQLNFGESVEFDKPVFDMLFKRMPWSMFISLYGLALGVSVSLILGALMAFYEGSKFDNALTIFSFANDTVPYYIVAIALIIVFGFTLEWFPTGGRYDTTLDPGFNLPFMVSVVRHATLPILAGFVAGFGGALAYRGNCVREMGKDYIRVGRLRGVSEGRLALRYIGRNALLPVYTGLMMGIAGIFGSSIIMEYIFNYQAVGLLTFRALKLRDYPLMMGSFIFFTAVTLLGILIADLTYGIIDPRVKGGSERESF